MSVIAERNVRSCARCGFTLAELLVANAVMAIALLGVYGLFRQMLAAEATTSRRWEDRAAAEAVLEHLAAAMQSLVGLPGKAAIVAEPDENGAVAVSCFTQAPMYRGVPVRSGGVSRRRYEWHGSQDGERRGIVGVRVLTYGGTKNLLPGVAEEESADVATWNQAALREIARDVDAMDMAFRAAADPNSAWQSQGSWGAGQVAVRIRVKVGNQAVERIVWPRANAVLADAREE